MEGPREILQQVKRDGRRGNAVCQDKRTKHAFWKLEPFGFAGTLDVCGEHPQTGLGRWAIIARSRRGLCTLQRRLALARGAYSRAYLSPEISVKN